MRRTVSDVVSWVRGISQSYFWWDATLKSHHESDLWFLGILQLLLGNRWCFATIPLHSLCLWCLSLPSSLRSLGAALRAALGVVLLGIPARHQVDLNQLHDFASTYSFTQTLPNAQHCRRHCQQRSWLWARSPWPCYTWGNRGSWEFLNKVLDTWCFWTCCFYSWIYWISNVYYH